jgi:hypothetical protein
LTSGTSAAAGLSWAPTGGGNSRAVLAQEKKRVDAGLALQIPIFGQTVGESDLQPVRRAVAANCSLRHRSTSIQAATSKIEDQAFLDFLGNGIVEAEGRSMKNTAQPKFEVADIVRRYQQNHKLSHEQAKVLRHIRSCRTAELGGHVQRCDHCGFEKIAYNSCRDRHCPKCQTLVKERWLNDRRAELLPCGYFHLVFTLQHDLNPIICCNKKDALDMLFSAVSRTLLSKVDRICERALCRAQTVPCLNILAVIHIASPSPTTESNPLTIHFEIKVEAQPDISLNLSDQVKTAQISFVIVIMVMVISFSFFESFVNRSSRMLGRRIEHINFKGLFTCIYNIMPVTCRNKNGPVV